jgi:membrane protease YdiL (CAAX protease family)
MAETDEPRGGLYRLAWAFYLLLAIAGVVWVGWREGTIPLALFVDPGGWWIDLPLGLATGAALLAAWEAGRRLLPAAGEVEEALGSLLVGLQRDEVVALAALSGFAEELFFRGAVQGSWGLLPATILFALLHTGRGGALRLWTVFAAIAGLSLGLLMLWRGNLLAPVTAHFLVNAVNLRRLVAAQEAEGEEGEGGESGPDV